MLPPDALMSPIDSGLSTGTPSHSFLVMALQVILPLLAAALTVTVGRAMRGRGVAEWALSWYALKHASLRPDPPPTAQATAGAAADAGR